MGGVGSQTCALFSGAALGLLHGLLLTRGGDHPLAGGALIGGEAIIRRGRALTLRRRRGAWRFEHAVAFRS